MGILTSVLLNGRLKHLGSKIMRELNRRNNPQQPKRSVSIFQQLLPSQRKACNLTCISHTASSPGLKAISLVCSQSHSFNLQQPSEPLIHLPKMTVTDSSAKQSIYFPSPPLWMYKTQQKKKEKKSVSGNSST